MSSSLQAPPGFFLVKEKDLKGLYKRRKELEQAYAKEKAAEQRADALVMAYYVLRTRTAHGRARSEGILRTSTEVKRTQAQHFC